MTETSGSVFADVMDSPAECLRLSLRPTISRYSLYSFDAIRFITRSVCAYLNLWLKELMIHRLRPRLSTSLSVRFPPISLCAPFNPFPSSPTFWRYPSHFVCPGVRLDSEPSSPSCLATFHRPSDRSLCYKTFRPASVSYQIPEPLCKPSRPIEDSL